jgi:hypothetical protein
VFKEEPVMRRALIAAVVIGGLSLATVLGLHLSYRTAAQAEDASAPAPAAGVAVALPVTQVVLFSSGVGYFQREGEVHGNTRIDLSFPMQDVNDLLKSMVLEDRGGGHISAVSYDSQAPVEKTLRSFAINLTNNPSLAEILYQARGEKVEVVLQPKAGGTLTGVIVGVEQMSLDGNGNRFTPSKQTVACNAEAAEAAAIERLLTVTLNLWCADGMRSLKLGDVQQVRFLNPALDSEVKKALEVLALSHDTQKKAVRLNFMGQGKRAVKVGYVLENPIWKTSYRLVLDNKGKPYLQGWAVVENTQDEDWNDVRMVLVSGRPISFQMDLYQPLNMTRPVVEPELFASLRPPTYQGAVQQAVPAVTGLGGTATAQMPQAPPPPVAAAAPMPVYMPGVASTGSAPGTFNGSGAPVPPSTVAPSALGAPDVRWNGANDILGGARGTGIDPHRGAPSAAVAAELGDFFQYQIEHPVTLPRQKSALLPIVNAEVEGTKVSIYNEATHAKFPLLGLRFKNTTKLHLMQGPVTVFDNSSYAGDARIMDLQPNEERLLSYAIDLGVEVVPAVHEPKEQLTQVKIVKGVLHSTVKIRDSKSYTIKNRTEHDRTVLLEHPHRPLFKLVAPDQAAERARDVYRFEVGVAAGKTVKHDVVEEREDHAKRRIAEIEEPVARLFLSQEATSEAVKAALTQALALRAKRTALEQEVVQNEGRLKEIGDDQARLRANLKEVPPASEAYKRYVKKFDAQESEIEQLQESIKKLQAHKQKQQEGYAKFLSELNAE